MKKKLKNIFKLFLFLFFVIVISYYSYVVWKMTRTSNVHVNNTQFILRAMLWNPVELVKTINNNWDSLYLEDENVKSSSSFSDLKKILEQKMKKNIYFKSSNQIKFDSSGNALYNYGTFIIKEKKIYRDYSYNVNNANGIKIYKKPIVKTKDFDETVKFSDSMLIVEQNLDLNNVNKNDLRYMVLNDIDKYRLELRYENDNSSENDKYIIFDSKGEIIRDIEY
jgi:hypothetical protein